MNNYRIVEDLVVKLAEEVTADPEFRARTLLWQRAPAASPDRLGATDALDVASALGELGGSARQPNL